MPQRKSSNRSEVFWGRPFARLQDECADEIARLFLLDPLKIARFCSQVHQCAECTVEVLDRLASAESDSAIHDIEEARQFQTDWVKSVEELEIERSHTFMYIADCHKALAELKDLIGAARSTDLNYAIEQSLFRSFEGFADRPGVHIAHCNANTWHEFSIETCRQLMLAVPFSTPDEALGHILRINRELGEDWPTPCKEGLDAEYIGVMRGRSASSRQNAEQANETFTIARAAETPSAQLQTARVNISDQGIVVIDGKEMAVRGENQLKVIKALIDARPAGLTFKELCAVCDEPHHCIGRMRRKGGVLSTVFHKAKNGRYQIL